VGEDCAISKETFLAFGPTEIAEVVSPIRKGRSRATQGERTAHFAGGAVGALHSLLDPLPTPNLLHQSQSRP
jgi:hypothetical protein